MTERTGGREIRTNAEEPILEIQERFGWKNVTVGEIEALAFAWNRENPVSSDSRYTSRYSERNSIIVYESGDGVKDLVVPEDTFIAWWESGYDDHQERIELEQVIRGKEEQESLSPRDLAVLWMRCRGMKDDEIQAQTAVSEDRIGHIGREVNEKLRYRIGEFPTTSKVTSAVAAVKSGLVPMSFLQNNIEEDVLQQISIVLDDSESVDEDDQKEYRSVLNAVYKTGSYHGAADLLGIPAAKVRKRVFELKEESNAENTVQLILSYSKFAHLKELESNSDPDDGSIRNPS